MAHGTESASIFVAWYLSVPDARGFIAQSTLYCGAGAAARHGATTNRRRRFVTRTEVLIPSLTGDLRKASAKRGAGHPVLFQY